MMVPRADSLKNGAREFWERAQEDLEKGRFNLTALDVEQAIQLWLKFLIFFKSGDYPKTHFFEALLRLLSEVYELPEILEFYNEHALPFRLVEDAYVTSRYFPKEFTRDEAEKIIEFASKVFKFLEEKVNEKLI